MKEPTLVILAAGMGSRYGGLKQMDPMDKEGHFIIDFSIYDAIKAGFKKVVFIIKHEIEQDFKAQIGKRIEPFAEVKYAYQDIDSLPAGYSKPTDRIKPWGTAHALIAAKDVIDSNFAVINADDYYGADAYKKLYDWCKNKEENDLNSLLLGYIIENTLTDAGTVARGVCVVDDKDYLKKIDERTKIKKTDKGAAYTLDEGKTWVDIPAGSTVSMNMWGFAPKLLDELVDRFPAFLDENLSKNPMKCEYLLPEVVGDLLKEGKSTIEVQRSSDKWYGVTYKEDKQSVMDAIQAMKTAGKYPEELWVK